MELTYAAKHNFHFRLDEPVKLNDHEIDTIRISIEWLNADDQGPDGWWITGKFQGWPLTSKGARDKRVKERETISLSLYTKTKYPIALWPAVQEAWAMALARTGIDFDSAPILNPDEGLFDPANYG